MTCARPWNSRRNHGGTPASDDFRRRVGIQTAGAHNVVEARGNDIVTKVHGSASIYIEDWLHRPVVQFPDMLAVHKTPVFIVAPGRHYRMQSPTKPGQTDFHGSYIDGKTFGLAGSKEATSGRKMSLTALTTSNAIKEDLAWIDKLVSTKERSV